MLGARAAEREVARYVREAQELLQRDSPTQSVSGTISHE
jgi:hypothetical protein